MNDTATAPAPADTAGAPAAPVPSADTAGTQMSDAPVGTEHAPAPTDAPAPNGTGLTDTPPADPGATDLNGSGQEADSNDWMTGLDDDTRQLVIDKNYKSPNDLGKAYKELSKKLGERPLSYPKEDASDQDRAAFRQSMGVPEAPEGYEFSPEGLPENIPYDSNFANVYKTLAHEAGLAPQQAKLVHDGVVKYTAEMAGQAAQKQASAIADTHAELQREWGEVGSETYGRNVELASRAIKQLGLSEALGKAGILAQGGNVTSAPIALALARVGEAMFSEDSMYTGPGTAPDNPFSKSTFNMTKQAQLIRNDPAKARVLAQAAGWTSEEMVSAFGE